MQGFWKSVKSVQTNLTRIGINCTMLEQYEYQIKKETLDSKSNQILAQFESVEQESTNCVKESKNT